MRTTEREPVLPGCARPPPHTDTTHAPPWPSAVDEADLVFFILEFGR